MNTTSILNKFTHAVLAAAAIFTSAVTRAADADTPAPAAPAGALVSVPAQPSKVIVHRADFLPDKDWEAYQEAFARVEGVYSQEISDRAYDTPDKSDDVTPEGAKSSLDARIGVLAHHFWLETVVKPYVDGDTFKIICQSAVAQEAACDRDVKRRGYKPEAKILSDVATAAGKALGAKGIEVNPSKELKPNLVPAAVLVPEAYAAVANVDWNTFANGANKLVPIIMKNSCDGYGAPLFTAEEVNAPDCARKFVMATLAKDSNWDSRAAKDSVARAAMFAALAVRNPAIKDYLDSAVAGKHAELPAHEAEILKTVAGNFNTGVGAVAIKDLQNRYGTPKTEAVPAPTKGKDPQPPVEIEF
jgi:hypothetical protein